MFLIDIAVPRNVAPEVNRIEHAFVYDLDDLQRLAERNLADASGSCPTSRKHRRRRSSQAGSDDSGNGAPRRPF